MKLADLGFGRVAVAAAMIAALSFLAPLTARALDEGAARAHVAAVFDRMTNIVEGGGGAAAQQTAFRAVLVDDIAYRDVARLSIGVTWRSMTEEQRDAFVAACLDYMTKSYSVSFDDFGGETLEIGSVVDQSENELLIDSDFVSANGGDRVEVIWRVIERDGGPKVLDVYIEGVSLLVTQRNEFESMLERNGDDVDELIRQIAR